MYGMLKATRNSRVGVLPWKATSGTESHVLQVTEFHKIGVFLELLGGTGIGHYRPYERFVGG
jgi:hypothetical protein